MGTLMKSIAGNVNNRHTIDFRKYFNLPFSIFITT